MPIYKAMKISAGELLILNKTFGDLMEKELPAKLAFRLAAYANKISPELQAAVSQHQKIMSRYAVETKPGVQEIRPDKMGDFLAVHDEFQKTTVEISSLDLTMEELETIPTLTVAQAAILSKVINDATRTQ